MADVPEGIVLKRDRDLEGRAWHIWVGRSILVVMAAFVVAALLNVFGQRPTTVTANVPAARLQLYAPTTVRSGLLFEARFHIDAVREIKRAVLVLDAGWAEGFSINTIEPSPISEGSGHGKLLFTLGHIPAGQTHVLYMQFQVNPTNVGNHQQNVELLDGSTRIALLHRTLTVFP
jgi:hypothetical protein